MEPELLVCRASGKQETWRSFIRDGKLEPNLENIDRSSKNHLLLNTIYSKNWGKHSRNLCFGKISAEFDPDRHFLLWINLFRGVLLLPTYSIQKSANNPFSGEKLCVLGPITLFRLNLSGFQVQEQNSFNIHWERTVESSENSDGIPIYDNWRCWSGVSTFLDDMPANPRVGLLFSALTSRFSPWNPD